MTGNSLNWGQPRSGRSGQCPAQVFCELSLYPEHKALTMSWDQNYYQSGLYS